MAEHVALVVGDWGTSSLRLWAMAPDGSVLAQRRSDDGMARLRPQDFEPVLRRHLAELVPAGPARVVLCGMVGARQGWREAGYVDVPATPAALCAQALAIEAAGLDVRILPGLAQRQAGHEDVMRGEETQILGLLLAEPALSGLVCLPGTHAKWVRLNAGQVVGFETVMTGEMFELLARHSVLQHSLAGEAASGDPGSPAFLRGADRGLAAPAHLLTALFGIRAANLLAGLTASAAADTLSGLLIGAEIAAAPPGAVTLVATGSLAALYEAVLCRAGRAVRSLPADACVQRGLAYAARRFWPGLAA